MSKEESTTKLTDALNKIKARAFLGYEIPNELTVELTTLISDYNQSIKNENVGKQHTART